MSAQVTGGEEVKIFTSGGEIDPNTYNVQFVKRDLVGLSCKETGITIKVNNQRIYKVNKKENEMNNESTAVIDGTTVTETPEFTTSTEVADQPTVITTAAKPKVKTPKAPPAKIDFDALVTDGFEVWTKVGLSLGSDPKVSAIQVAAHCVIDPEPDASGYEVFNSYNGTRGAKGKGGKRYDFSEKMTLEKKRKTLEKKGYIQHTV